MKIPAWSAFVIVPALLLIAAFPVIRNSESPWMLVGGVFVVALITSVLAWGVLRFLDKRK